MSQTVIHDQISLFLYACLLGIGFGIYYDIFRFAREIGFNSDINILIQDIFFTVSIAPATFLFFTAFNNGVIRIFAIAGQFGGLLLYRYTFGVLTMKIFKVLVIPVRAIINLIRKPFRTFEVFLIKRWKSYVFNLKVNKNKRIKDKQQKSQEKAKLKTEQASKSNKIKKQQTANQSKKGSSKQKIRV